MLHLNLPRFLAMAALGCLLPSFAAAQAVRIVDRVDESRLATLRGNTHPAARAANDRGAIDEQTPMTDLVLVLSRDAQRQAAFEKFVSSLYDPKSPNFHQWLKPEEVGERFGPAASDLAAVQAWLTGRGLHVDSVSNDRLSIRFSGTAADVQSAFHTRIHNLMVKGEPHIANMSDPQIPEALAPVVVGVKALHNFFPRPQHKLGSKVVQSSASGGWIRPRTALHTGSAHSNPLMSINDPSNNYLVEDVTPYDFAAIYNVAPLWNKGINGAGQTIAIAGTSDISTSDLTAFRSTFGLPAVPSFKTIVANGTDPGQCANNKSTAACTIGDQVENTLDVEWSGAVAPGANLVLVVAGANSSTTDTLYASEKYIVDHATAKIMNVSYGECELGMGTAGNVEYYNLWSAAAAEGIAVFVATGDSGSPSCDQGGDTTYGTPYAAEFGLSVSGMASTPFNTAVGGTDLNWCPPTASTCTAAPYWSTTNTTTTKASAKGYMPEVPWNSTCVSPAGISYVESVASDFGVSGVTNAESACNFVAQYWDWIYSNYDTDISWLLDTVGGSGGRSNCVVNDGSKTTSCASTITSTGAANGSIPLVNDGWKKPAWQTGVTGIGSNGMRTIPDVSFFASSGFLGSAYLMCVSAEGACSYTSTTENTAQEVGGTSVASPAMAGVMALINQKAGGAQGSPNAELYTLAAKQTWSRCTTESGTVSDGCYFNDIDTGTNAMACDYGDYGGTSPNCSILYSGDGVGLLSGFSAGTGYDMATGLGSLNVANVVNAWPATVVAPKVTLSATKLAFPATLAGTKSAAQTVTVKNSGNAALTLSSIAITGTGAANFTKTTTCGSSLAAGASCAVNVIFTPASGVAYSASLNFTDNASGSPQPVTLSGQGTIPLVTLAPASLAYGSVLLGSSLTKSVVLKNTGTGNLNLASIAIGGLNIHAFSQTNNCGVTVAPGHSCTIQVKFAPPVVLATYTASVIIRDNALKSPQAIALTGAGVRPVATLSHPSLAFGSVQVGSSAKQSVVLNNTGTAPLAISSISLAGTNLAYYSQTNTCGSSLAIGHSCAITVTFAPRVVSPSLTAMVKITDNAPGSPQSVTLSGAGLGPVATLSVTSVSFGAIKVNTTRKIGFTMKSTGARALGVSSISIAGTNASSFSQTNTCGTSLAIGQSCTITVTFAPKVVSSSLAATVKITDSAPGSPQSVALTGSSTN